MEPDPKKLEAALVEKSPRGMIPISELIKELENSSPEARLISNWRQALHFCKEIQDLNPRAATYLYSIMKFWADDLVGWSSGRDNSSINYDVLIQHLVDSGIEP